MVSRTLSTCVKFYYYIKLRWAETTINNLISLSKWAWQTVYFPKIGTWFFSICNVWVEKNVIVRGTNTSPLTKIYWAEFKPAVHTSQWSFLFFQLNFKRCISCQVMFQTRGTYRKDYQYYNHILIKKWNLSNGDANLPKRETWKKVFWKVNQLNPSWQ